MRDTDTLDQRFIDNIKQVCKLDNSDDSGILFSAFLEINPDLVGRRAVNSFILRTMPQLQNLYEAILEVHFDRRNFASKMLKLGILEDTGDRPAGASSRIPVSYRFNKDKYNELKAKEFRLEF